MSINNISTENEQIVASLLLRMNREDELLDAAEAANAEVQGNGSNESTRRFQKILSANIQPATRKKYQDAFAKFLTWVFGTDRRTILHSDVLAALSQEALKESPKLLPVAKSFVQLTSRSFHPMDLSQLTVQDFVTFLLSLKPEDEFLSKSYYGGFRSGLFNQFRESGKVPSDEFERDLEQSFAGLKRESQRFKAKNGGKLGEGKQPLPFPLYKKLCEWMIEEGSKEAIFSWSFLTLTWNLICRSKNTTNIHRNHIGWEHDSLVIQFAHHKTDMLGNEEAVKRHVFANPNEPSICPVLALSVYFATVPSRTMGLLFKGNNQYERFRKNLLGLVSKHKDAVIAMGIDPDEIGVHSIRKGAATYACSGTTSSPSMGGVCNRAGWTMGKVKDTYIRYEAAQDQYVGRLVAGLNIHSFEFSISPPYFQTSVAENAHIKNDMDTVFAFPIETKHILVMQFCLASLIHLKPFLLAKLGAASPLRKSDCLKPGGLESQAHWVRTKFAHDEVDLELKICGIPPHVIQLQKLEQIRVELSTSTREYHAAIVTAHTNLLKEFRQELDARSIGGGQITVSRIEEMIKPLSDRLSELLEAPRPAAISTVTQEPEDVTGTNGGRRTELYRWGANMRHRRLPENYRIETKMTVLAVWQLWHHGDHICFPFKFIDQIDICDTETTSGRKRPMRDTEVHKLNDMRFLCRSLDEAVGLSIVRKASKRDLVSLYNTSDALKNILPSQETPCNRVRRAEELNWLYAAKVMRKQQRMQAS